MYALINDLNVKLSYSMKIECKQRLVHQPAITLLYVGNAFDANDTVMYPIISHFKI